MLAFIIAGAISWVIILGVYRSTQPPPTSDCPHCVWYNPEPFGRSHYLARIDHMLTFHGIAIREESLR